MPTIAIVSQKGGSGKTTLAVHLATAAEYAGARSCVIDTDPQATAAAWGDWRGEFQPQVITCPPIRLPRTIQTAEREGIGFIVIDTPPTGDSASRDAARAADMILVPTRARAFDLHAMEATAQLVSYARKPAFVVLNGVRANATRMIESSRKAIEELGLKVCPVHLGERADFHRTVAAGEVASEVAPDGKAASEMAALYKWVVKQLAKG